MDIIKKRVNSSDLIFYKSNPFIEPIKRVNFEHSSLNTFEVERN